MKVRVKIILCSLLTLVILMIQLSLKAQWPVSKSFDIRTENTRPRILKLLLDHNGLIWTGTDQGVFTFDGINFTKIHTGDAVVASVSSLFEDKEHCIWAGFENGKIIQIKNFISTRYNPEEGFPKVAISAFAQDDSGRVFFSTKGEGVYFIRNNRMFNINHDDGLSDDYCYSMVELPDGRICVGSDAGLNFINVDNGKKKVNSLGTSDGLPDDIARTLVLDKSKMLWIGLQERGLAEFDYIKNKIIPVELKKPWSYGQINCVLTIDNKLWISTEEQGIILLDKDGYSSTLELNGEKNIKANDLLLDPENNLWISESIHLIRTSGDKISFLSSVGKKNFRFVHCMACDRNGDIWFSPDQQIGHLHISKDGSYQYNEYKITDKKVDIVTLYFDPYGFLWIGTLGDGVYRFNPETGKSRKVTETVKTENSSILSVNGKGNVVWVAGFNSVMKFNIRNNGNSDEAVIEEEKKFKDSHLLNDYVYSVFIDSKGNTWFGTDGSGIYCFDGKELKNYPVPDNSIHGFTEDKKGRIWFSTADAGLKYFDGERNIHSFQTKDGLSDPTPTSLLCTSTGNILIVHDNGFDVLDPETKDIIYHSSEENLDGINCDLNSIAMSPDNSVWMGTERGIMHYLPSDEMVLKRPKIVLQSVSVFLKGIDFKNQNKFSADENNIRFDYNGFWYSDPQRVNYIFILDGYSNKWESTKDQTVTFPKLPPGKYAFRVKASLNSNFERAEETSYSFVITPPLWQRWWFRLLTAITVSVIILIIVKRREERIRKFDRLQHEKIEFRFETLKSQVNPHFLFNSFNTLISVIEETPKQAVEYVERLSDFFRNLVNYRDKNLITVSEELSLLDNYIFIQKKRYGCNLAIVILIDEATKAEKCVPPLTLQLLAENALKHNAISKESPLTITIKSFDDRLEFSNNLNPKITRESSAGFGLHNIISMYELLTKEKVKIIKVEHTFTVIIPLLKNNNEYSDS